MYCLPVARPGRSSFEPAARTGAPLEHRTNLAARRICRPAFAFSLITLCVLAVNCGEPVPRGGACQQAGSKECDSGLQCDSEFLICTTSCVLPKVCFDDAFANRTICDGYSGWDDANPGCPIGWICATIESPSRAVAVRNQGVCLLGCTSNAQCETLGTECFPFPEDVSVFESTQVCR